MADQKISALTDGDPAQSGDQIPVNRGGTNRRITVATIIANMVTAASNFASGGLVKAAGANKALQSADLSGDVSTTGSMATTLATVNASPGTFTNASVTVDAKGRVTAAATGNAVTLKIDGVNNSSQVLLNLISGNSVGFTDTGSGAIKATVQSLTGSGTFGGAGAALTFVIAPGFANANAYVVLVSYDSTAALVAPGILSVVYTDGTHFNIVSSSATDASKVRWFILNKGTP